MADHSLDDLSREELLQRCLSAEDNMKKAATFGNSLLTQLSQERTERSRLQTELTALEQANHELRGQLEVRLAMERSAGEELEAVQREAAEAKAEAAASREEARRLEQNLRADLHKEMLKAEAAEAEAGRIAAQAEQEVASARAEAEELRQQLESCGQNSADSFNISKISGDLAEIRDEKAALEQELASSAANQRALRAELKAAKAQLEEAAEVLRVREEKIACLKEQMEALQAQHAVLSSELDMARASGGSRGNSLFSELEDRRIRAERCLVEQQERSRVLEERYRAKVRELREFKEDVGSQMIMLRHQRKEGGAAAMLWEADKRCAQLEAELKERRADADRQARAQELELQQQLQLAAAFGEGSGQAADSSASEALVRINKQKSAALSKALEQRETEVMKLRSDRREALGRSERLEAELRESETARLKLTVQLEGLKEELGLQRGEKKAPKPRQPEPPLDVENSPPPASDESGERPPLQALRMALKTVNLDLVNEPKSDSGELAVRFASPEKKAEEEKGKERKEKGTRTVRQPPKVKREADQDPECKQM